MKTAIEARNRRSEPALWPMAPVLLAVLAIVPASIVSMPRAQQRPRIVEMTGTGFVPGGEEIECDPGCGWRIHVPRDHDYEPPRPMWYAVIEPLAEIKLDVKLFANW